MLFLCYSRCSTCQKAKKWLQSEAIAFDERDIVSQNPSYDELKKWYALSGLPIKKLFNTSGKLYKELNLKEQLKTMSDDDCLKLLSSNGMLVKRPIVVKDHCVLIGFKEEEWNTKLK